MKGRTSGNKEKRGGITKNDTNGANENNPHQRVNESNPIRTGGDDKGKYTGVWTKALNRADFFVFVGGSAGIPV